MSTISDHNLVDITPKLKRPRINPCKVTVRSYKNYKVGNFLHDLSLTPFHITSVFDDLNDQVDAFHIYDIFYLYDIKICQWCCKNSPLINPSKTKVLIFGVPQLLRRLPLFKLKLFNKQISTETVAKDLGVQLDANLIYNEHIIKSVSNCLFKLKQINRIKHLLDRKTSWLLMNAFVFNKLLYCSSVWSNSNIDKLQKVQNLLDESF